LAKTKKIKISEFTDKAAYDYFINFAKKQECGKSLSSEDKISKIKKIRRKVLAISALYGALGVIVLYVPQYIFPDLFKLDDIKVPYTDFTFKASINELIYGVFLVAVEIWLLTMTDIRSVGKIASVYGFPPDEEKDVNHEEDATELVYISLGKDNGKLKEIGINPYRGTSKAGVFLIILVFRAKAVLSKFVFQFILKRTLGRLAVRSVIDMAGIPIYAFWNAYASAVVIRKASMRMRAHELMHETGKWFNNRFQNNEEFKDLLYDTFEYIAFVKKSFHPTDYLFAKYFLSLFKIQPEIHHEISTDFIDRVASSPDKIKKAIGKLLIIGFLMDGKLGRLEIAALKELKPKGIVTYDIKQIKHWSKEYLKGKSFDKLLREK